MPDFGFSCYGGCFTHFFLAECVDDGRFAGVGVADETNGDLFPVGVERRELTEERDESAFAEGVCQGGVEG